MHYVRGAAKIAVLIAAFKFIEALIAPPPLGDAPFQKTEAMRVELAGGRTACYALLTRQEVPCSPCSLVPWRFLRWCCCC